MGGLRLGSAGGSGTPRGPSWRPAGHHLPTGDPSLPKPSLRGHALSGSDSAMARALAMAVSQPPPWVSDPPQVSAPPTQVSSPQVSAPFSDLSPPSPGLTPAPGLSLPPQVTPSPRVSPPCPCLSIPSPGLSTPLPRSQHPLPGLSPPPWVSAPSLGLSPLPGSQPPSPGYTPSSGLSPPPLVSATPLPRSQAPPHCPSEAPREGCSTRRPSCPWEASFAPQPLAVSFWPLRACLAYWTELLEDADGPGTSQPPHPRPALQTVWVGSWHCRPAWWALRTIVGPRPIGYPVSHRPAPGA